MIQKMLPERLGTLKISSLNGEIDSHPHMKCKILLQNSGNKVSDNEKDLFWAEISGSDIRGYT